jgi:4-hydroxybenzoyl-CoA reductase subunit beta
VYYNQSDWWRGANAYCLKYRGDTCHVAPQGKRCHAASSSDLAPVLLALGADAILAGAGGERREPLGDIYREDGAAPLAFAAGEILVSVRIPAPPPGSRSGYRKARVRGAMDFPLAGVAAQVATENGRLSALRIALGGTNSRPFVLEGTGALLEREPDGTALALLGKLVQKQVTPMRTTAASADWRRQAASVLARRLVRELAGAQ